VKSSLLNIAVGAGAIEVSQHLLLYYGLVPTRETIEQALALGLPELIQLIWQALPGAEQVARVDLLQVAAEFHREASLAWLLAKAGPWDRATSRVRARAASRGHALDRAAERSSAVVEPHSRARVEVGTGV
jgi:hypothetical protein